MSVDGRVCNDDAPRGEEPGCADGAHGIAAGPVDAGAMLVATPEVSLPPRSPNHDSADAPNPAEPADDQAQATCCDEGADLRTVWSGSASQLKAELRARGISEQEITSCSEKDELVELLATERSVAESGISEVGAPEEAAVNAMPLVADSAMAETHNHHHLVTPSPPACRKNPRAVGFASRPLASQDIKFGVHQSFILPEAPQEAAGKAVDGWPPRVDDAQPSTENSRPSEPKQTQCYRRITPVPFDAMQSSRLWRTPVSKGTNSVSNRLLLRPGASQVLPCVIEIEKRSNPSAMCASALSAAGYAGIKARAPLKECLDRAHAQQHESQSVVLKHW
jgi:hypothetical protein